MITNYFKIAIRNFFKYKVFSLINLLGISAGMTSAMFVLYYVLFETNFDRFHQYADRVYRIEVANYSDGFLDNESALTPPAVGKSLKDLFQEVEGFTRIAANAGKTIVISADKSYREDKTYLAEPSIFKCFDIRFIQGSPESALSEPFDVIISERLVEKIFGSDWQASPVLNKTIDLRSQGLTGTFKIAGVFENLPANSHFKPEILGSRSYLTEIVGDLAGDDSWNFNFFYTYVKLAPHTDSKALQKRYNTHLKNSRNEMSFSDFRFRPLTDIHLKSKAQFELDRNGDAKTVYLLGLVGVIILMVAWINFINLTTARSIKRAKEVGVRKVLGASKGQLVSQLTAEAVLMNLAALTLALPIFHYTKSIYSDLSGIPLNFVDWKVIVAYPRVVFALLLFFGSGIILSGIYPAFVLTNFNPVKALKGEILKPRGINLRKVLLIAQFVVSVVMTSATFIVFKQVNFMRSTDLGIDIERTLVIESPENFDSVTDGAAVAFKQSIKDLPFVMSVARSSVIPGNEVSFISYNLTNKKSDVKINCGIAGVDYDYFQGYKIEMAAGRSFSFSGDKDKVIINEEAAKQLGYRTPDEALGSKLIHSGQREKEEFEVIGVVKNFHQRSLKSAVEPMMFLNERDLQFYSVKLKSQGWNDLQNSVSILAQQFQHYFPRNPFNFHFLDQHFDGQYKTELQFSKVFFVFSIIAMIISSLGLIGISTFVINLRTKEIGIRKIFGASDRTVTVMLLKDYFYLLGIAAIIGIPLVWYVANKWLMEYPYRIELNVLTLSLPVFILTLILVMTTGLQSFQAASGNPINTIKSE